MSFFLHFSSTYIHQTLQFYSYLSSEGFYWVCSYIIHTDLYNMVKMSTKSNKNFKPGFIQCSD